MKKNLFSFYIILAVIGLTSILLFLAPGKAAGQPGPATLISPSGTITTATPTYTWHAVSGSTWYLLWVDDSTESGKVREWYTASQAGCGSGTGTCSVTPATSLASGSGNWWIQTCSAGTGPWSSGMSFSVDLSGGDPDFWNLKSPGWGVVYFDHRASDASVQTLTFKTHVGPGSFLAVGALVVLNQANPQLTDLSQVKEVRATYVYPDTTTIDFQMREAGQWLNIPGRQFYLLLRAEPWQWKNKWKITITYQGIDETTHHQTKEIVYANNIPNDPVTPFIGHISGVRFQETQAGLKIWFAAVGDPTPQGSPFDYRVRIQDVDTGDTPAEIRGTWMPCPAQSAGWCYDGITYDPSVNQIIVPVPENYIGLPYSLRLEATFGARGNGTPFYGDKGTRSTYNLIAPK